MKIKLFYPFIFCFTFFATSTHAQNALAVTVFEDLDGNGLEDPGEPTISGVLTTELRLWQDINNNGAVDGGDTEFTHDGGSGGVYTFGTGNVLPDDNYIMEYIEMGNPGAYYVTQMVNGVGLVDMDNDLDPLTNSAGFFLSGDTPETLIDLGLVIGGNIGSFVWKDLNGDGIQDPGEPGINAANATLLDAATMTVVVNNIDFVPLINPVTTSAGGMYSFDNLPPGQYIVEFSEPAPSPDLWYPTEATIDTDATDSTNDSDAENNPVSPNYLQSHTIILLSDETDEEDKIDAGFFQTSIIGDWIWHDLNGDGIQDPGEQGIDGITVSLFDELTGGPATGVFGDPIPDQVTAGGGFYQFELVPPGEYRVQFSQPAPTGGLPWIPTEFDPFDTDADDPATDSDANNDFGDANYLKSHVIITLSGETDEELRIDAGFFQAPANDDCNFDNPDILIVSEGTTLNAEYDLNTCGINDPLYDHQVFYRYTNNTGSNVDLEITLDASPINSNPATQVSITALEDECDLFTYFYDPNYSSSEWCDVLGIGIQTLPCIAADETVILLLSSADGEEGDFLISANENTTQPSENNDECIDAKEIVLFNTCEWEIVTVDNHNACPEGFSLPGGCSFASDPTVWYSFTVPPIPGNYTLEIQNIEDQFSYLTLYELPFDCDDPGSTAIFADCESGPGPHVEYDPLIPGNTYLIAFGNPTPGIYSFEIKINLHPENDECIDAINLLPFTPAEGTTICATQEAISYNSNVCIDQDETNTVWYQYTVFEGEKGFELTITSSTINPIFGDINVVIFEGVDCEVGEVVGEICTTSAQLNEDFECVGPGNYLIRVSTGDLESGDFEIVIEPLTLFQPNDFCDVPLPSFESQLENEWMTATANTLGACPEDLNDPANCGLNEYPVVWYEATAPSNAEFLDLQIISGGTFPIIAVFESLPLCDDLIPLNGSSCFTGIFIDLDEIGETQIVVTPDSDYLIAIGSDDPSGSIVDFGIKWVTPGGPCPGGENIGDPCDDEDACTIDDIINEDCECEGMFQDSDADGTCDADDLCADGPEPGTDCDDEDACTVNDTINEACECVGTFQDTDDDGVCDADDVCADGPEPGMTCDDADICTEDDVITEDCQCAGTYMDSDNDGICDAEDVCDDGPEPGAACDDNDDCTIDDVVNEDCICMGTFIDTDEDGTCDAEDVCPGGPEPGTACDDENVCTINDVIDEDCFCVGTFVDSDFDGTCDAEDVCNGGPEPGTPCNDEDPCTVDDAINEDCECVGIFQDSDNDGTCDVEDLCENAPEPGTNCDDGNESTFNDQITSDCICVGTTDTLYCPGLDLNIGDMCEDEDECTINDIVNSDCACEGEYVDSDEDGTCDANDQCPDGPEPGTACDDENETTINDQINMDCICMGALDSTYCTDLDLYIGDPCNDNDTCTTNDIVDEDCNCIGTFQDTDDDGVCDAEDICPGGPEPGTACDDGNEATINDVINADCICVGEVDSIYCTDLELYVGDPCDDNDACTVDDIVEADCNCVGTFQDSDEDGVCDAEDVCPDGPEPGTLCDDMNSETVNDEINEDCVCMGVIIPGYCPELDLFVGDACDDGDICTVTDTVNEDCECVGEFEDSDEDGFCDAEDSCPGIANEDQSDNDEDGFGDVCDGDDDNDGIPDEEDNCPLIPNEDQSDEDMDGIGDPCDVLNADNQLLDKISLYPNPSKGILFIESSTEVYYSVFNVQGEMVLKSDIKVGIINISLLPPGLYFIELYDQDNRYGFYKIFKMNN